MALKTRGSSSNSKTQSTVCSTHMRYSVKLLIGLAMPGVALAALWLWKVRRAHQQNDSSDSDMSRTLQDVAEEFKTIRQKRRDANNVSTKTLDRNGSVESGGGTMGYLVVPGDCSGVNTRGNGKIGNNENTNEIIKTNCTKLDSQPAKYDDKTKEESLNFSGQLDISDEKNIDVVSDAFKGEPSSKLEDNDTDSSHQQCVTSQETSEIVSTREEKESGRKEVCAGASISRAQSLDDSSDVSSTDSPLDQKLTSITSGSDCEHADDETAEEVTWELEFPQALCGRLIGKKGKNVQKISQITGTKIRLIPQNENTESSQRLVALTGSPKQLRLALRALREKFPSVPFTRLNGSQPFVEESHNLPPNMIYVALPENDFCQVFVTNIVDASHFSVQLYDHAIQSHLRQLDQQMYQCYAGVAAAGVPQAINTGMLCAVPSPSGWWRRAQVVGLLMKPDEVEITWLDYGGRTNVSTTMLRRLRSDFLQLPFQAVECYLSNLVPNHGETTFSMAACALFEQLTQNVVLTARVAGYTKDCPSLELYTPEQWTGQPLFVNREFVRRGFARWSET
ncbi:A-kinase anchor protein 1, mitochondrial-like isoform X2 [Dendronephthya gigantea]|uniref:A-kinase anchor protein 1, mitochondrial-like isoform X2 n=1 Tax=Dendronephthya gigantea TaxID=151771 RepID=UPI0010694FEC|nr:A-kinase anchor protein 1, mitochondrial-like isoform X2 [Dendronephthya gigantea]